MPLADLWSPDPEAWEGYPNPDCIKTRKLALRAGNSLDYLTIRTCVSAQTTKLRSLLDALR